MEIDNIIRKFISARPEVLAVYGYGSGVFKQAGYDENDKPQLDLIFVVKDIKKWNMDNIVANPTDYSFTGKRFFKRSSREKLIGNTGVTYLSNIPYEGLLFKYGVVDYESFKNSLLDWSSFYITGRFHKTIKEFKSTKEIRDIVNTNRRSAIITSLLITKDKSTIKELLLNLCQLSYAGDTRMGIAENPHKVMNIVEGSYDEFIKLYGEMINKYASLNVDIVGIDDSSLDDLYTYLPCSIKDVLSTDDLSDIDLRTKDIMDYLSELNRSESKAQTIKGLKTNGFTRSLSYGFAKVKKRFKK